MAVKAPQPVTQKAKGVALLARVLNNEVYDLSRDEAGFRTGVVRIPTPVAVLNAAALADLNVELELLAQLAPLTKTETMLRPCPEVPCHGFVESRMVPRLTLKELLTAAKAVHAADPKGELLLMPAIKAAANMIWTPGQVVLGPGHDGATAGKDTITIGLARTAFSATFKELCTLAGVGDDQAPYLEAVIKDGELGQLYLTQLRAGPSLPGGLDFIPKGLTVTAVVEATGDLLEWAAKVKTFTPGTIVWHPGGSLASHYGVHCVLNNVPIVTTFQPIIGQMVEPIEFEVVPDLDWAVKGFIAGQMVRVRAVSSPNWNPTSAFYMTNHLVTALAAMHNAPFMSGEAAYFAGYAVGMIHRLGTAACMGEARHGNKLKKPSSYTGERDVVYARAFDDPIDARGEGLADALSAFTDLDWHKASGCGGEPWRDCAKAMLLLDRSAWHFVKAPTKTTYREMLEELNRVVNMVHHNGWWLNKFGGQELFDSASQGKLDSVLAAVPGWWALWEQRGNVSVWEQQYRQQFEPLNWEQLLAKESQFPPLLHIVNLTPLRLNAETGLVDCAMKLQRTMGGMQTYYRSFSKDFVLAFFERAKAEKHVILDYEHEGFYTAIVTMTESEQKHFEFAGEVVYSYVGFRKMDFDTETKHGEQVRELLGIGSRSTRSKRALGDELHTAFAAMFNTQDGTAPLARPPKVELDDPDDGCDSCTNCDNCDANICSDDGNVYWSPSGDSKYCEDCYDARYFSCGKCGETVHLDDRFTHQVTGVELCEPCYDLDHRECAQCNDWAHESKMKPGPDGELYHTECWEALFYTCSNCGDILKLYDECSACTADEDEDNDGTEITAEAPSEAANV